MMVDGMDDFIKTLQGEMEQQTGLLGKTKSSKSMLFKKEGKSNIIKRGIRGRRGKYLKDLYITLVDIRWRWAILILTISFFTSYLLFAVVYYYISYFSGDLASGNQAESQTCLKNVNNFWDAMLFSVETQSTIGYGTIYPVASCLPMVPVIFVQVTIGFVLETFLLGFIFMKVARPKHRRHTLIFSNKACVCLEDQQLTLQVRVADIRNTPLIDTRVLGVLIRSYTTQEGVVYPLYQHDIKFKAFGMSDQLFMFYPLVLSHTITDTSPLCHLSSANLSEEDFELVVVLEGTIESTGEMVQARTSISNAEICWGQRFVQMEEYDPQLGQWCINFNHFNQMVPVDTPKCSSRQLLTNPLSSELTV